MAWGREIYGSRSKNEAQKNEHFRKFIFSQFWLLSHVFGQFLLQKYAPGSPSGPPTAARELRMTRRAYLRMVLE